MLRQILNCSKRNTKGVAGRRQRGRGAPDPLRANRQQTTLSLRMKEVATEAALSRRRPNIEKLGNGGN
jgi:hypothetical protein